MDATVGVAIDECDLPDVFVGPANPMNARVAKGAFLQAISGVATPGVVAVDLPRGIWISEWPDADAYEMEFIEISIR